MKKTFKKRAFISAIAMLIVSAIVLTSATYAWFSMAKRVEVESMELNVTSPEGIQISANTSAFTTKLTVDNIKGTDETAAGKRFNAYANHMNNVPETVKPSSTGFYFSNNGYPQWFDGSINDTGTMDIYKTDEVGSGIVAFDIFVKVKSRTTVKFGKSTVTCAGNDELPTAMRIALVNCGTVTEKADSTEILAAKPQTNGYKVYEVDAENHTATATAAGASGIMDTVSICNAKTNVPTSAQYNNIVASDNSIAWKRYSPITEADKATIDVAGGISRVRVYMWMEGNDVDCANDVAGSTINFNLVLEID